MPNNNKNLIDASKICSNNEAVNNLIIENLNGFTEIKNLEEMQPIMNGPFMLSNMRRGTVMGGSYEPIVATLNHNEPNRKYKKNKARVFDDFTINNLSDEDKARLYVTNAIYATSKSKLLESAEQYRKDNNYDYFKFSDTDTKYTMTRADFDFYYKDTKITTQTLEIKAKAVVTRTKEDIRGFIGYNVDIDDVNSTRAKNFINDINNGAILMPTMIIVTGTGLHIWYIFTSPIAIKNEKELQKYQTMHGLFSRKFTHNPRYCGKEEETGSFQHDLPIGQLMRAVGNIYDKYEGCNFPIRGYTSGIYYDFKALNEWANIPEIEISKKSSVIKYDSNKARKLSSREYQALFDSLLTESVGHRTRHRNMLFYHMLVEGGMSFESALVTINNIINEVNRLYPVEGNMLRNLIEKEARKFDPKSNEFDLKYYQKYLSTGAMVNSQIYKNHIKQEKHRTGLSQSENMKKVCQETVRNIKLRAECLLYAIVNNLNNDRKNKSGEAIYHRQQCIVNGYDFTPFVMAHSTIYNLGKDERQRTVKSSYEIIDNPNNIRHQILLARVFDYLNGITTQRVGSTDIYSNRQELIHNLLLASTSQETRDEFYNRYVDVKVPGRYTKNSEELYREIRNYFNILLSLAHHHFDKIKEGVRGERAYITGKILTENYNKVNDAIRRILKLLNEFNKKREIVVKKGVSVDLINAINATNNKSLAFVGARETTAQEIASNELYAMLLNFTNDKISMVSRFDEYENILNHINTTNVELTFDNVFNLWIGNNMLNRQAKKDEALFISELNRRWDRLHALLPIIQRTDSLIRRLIHKGKGGKLRLHGTFMYMCFMHHHLGFLDILPPDVGFPFATAYKYVGLELTEIGRQFLEYNHDYDKAAELTYPTYDPRTGKRGYSRRDFTDREYMMTLAKYYSLSGKYRTDEEIMYKAKQLAIFLSNNDYRFRDIRDTEIRAELLSLLKSEVSDYLDRLHDNAVRFKQQNEVSIVFEDNRDDEAVVENNEIDGNTEILDETINIVLDDDEEEDIFDSLEEKNLLT